ncbi:MAG: efflux RND transporter periplasmic adaptor subunit [Salinibacter sp.]
MDTPTTQTPPHPDGPAAPTTGRPTDLEATLGLGAERRRPWGRWIGLALLLGAVAVAVWWWSQPAAPVSYQMQDARQGTLTLSVTATGALAAVTTVEVGSEISGLVETVTVEANESVERGQVLATLDTERLRAEVTQAEANRTAARAALAQAVATRDEQRLQTARTERLAAQEFVAPQEREAARAALDRAEAAVTSSESQIAVAEAALDVTRTTLRKASIRAPIDGLVLSRNVDPGQAVAASFQTPVLFTLAEDLRRMELRVDVDEADVGPVAANQSATFTVDAYPGRTFPASVIKVHYAPKTGSGVVTYEAVLTVDNSDGVLRPGMTATAEITTETVADTRLVPNSALRFTPPGADPPERAEGQEFVWVLQEDTPVAIPVTPGRTDGVWTVVQDGDVEPGQALLTNIDTPDA